jgi:hypothetical protein
MNAGAGTLTLDQWQILFHETMAALLRAKEAAKKPLGWIGLITGLWRSSRDLGKLNAAMKMLSESPDGVLGEEFLKSHIPQTRKLLMSIEELLDTSKIHGLTNRTVTAAPLETIRSRGEYVADYLEALEMSIDPAVLQAIEQGHEEFARGEVITMEQLF